MNSLVVIRFGAFGDTLMLTPVFRYLARHFGMPVDYAGRGPWSRPLLQPHPAVADVRQIHSKRVPCGLSGEQQALVQWLGERRGGVFLDLENDAKSASLLSRAGVPADRIWRVRGIPVDPQYRHQVHTTLSRVRSRVEGRGWIDDLDVSLHVAVPSSWRADLEAWLAARGWAGDDLIVVAPGNKRTMSWRPYGRSSNRKHWPVAAWGRLCDRVLADAPQRRVLIVGAPVEQRLTRAVRDAARSDRIHAVAQDMTVSRLLALLKRARGAITLDSGPAHAAAAVGCPVVALFKATEPVRFRPLSRNDNVRIVTPGDMPIEQWRPGAIHVEQVYEAWCELQGREHPVQVAAFPESASIGVSA